MRILLRVLAPLVALAVAAVGAVVLVETVTAWLAPGSVPLLVPWPRWRTGLDTLTWSAAGVRAAAVGVGVVGLALLLVALAARRRDVPLAEISPEVTATTSPRSLARAVGHHVRGLPGVGSATVVASRRRITVRAGADDADGVRGTVREQVDELLSRLPLARRPVVRISVTTHRAIR